EPGKRYASAGELAEELGRFQRGEPVQARPLGRGARAWRWCRRNAAVATLLLAVLLTLLAGMGAATAVAVQAAGRARELVLAGNQLEERARQLGIAKNEADKAREAEKQRAETEKRAREDAENAKQDADAARQKEKNARENADAQRVRAEWLAYVGQ